MPVSAPPPWPLATKEHRPHDHPLSALLLPAPPSTVRSVVNKIALRLDVSSAPCFDAGDGKGVQLLDQAANYRWGAGGAGPGGGEAGSSVGREMQYRTAPRCALVVRDYRVGCDFWARAPAARNVKGAGMCKSKRLVSERSAARRRKVGSGARWWCNALCPPRVCLV